MNQFNRLFAVILGVCTFGMTALPWKAAAQFTQQFALQNSPEYEAEASRLREAPPREYDFSKALLSDVLRFLADDAGISFFGLPEGSENADRLVTFSLRTCPFTALETLAKANGIALIHDNGLWYLRPADDSELIGRVYQINYNSQEMVTKSSSSAASGNSSSGGQGSGLSLQGAPNTFEREPSKLIEDIKEILNLPSGRGILAPTISVDSFGQLSAANIRGQQNLVAPVAGRTADDGGVAANGNSIEPVARVIWSSDSNTLYVVATRQQHQWIEGYLASADQQQDLIAVEVKFFESSKDPRSELGLDWTGTLAGGYGANLNVPPSDIDLNRTQDYRIPSTAVLSYDDVTVRLRALANDRDTRTVSYPRMLTLDNREVVFRSVINQPVLSSDSSTSLGAGATETTAIDYLPIGTVINILPKRMANDNILLHISIEVSDIIGEEIINGNPFPIATSRVYGAPVQVESGYTVAISGLDEAENVRAESGVPFLRKIPLLGWAFKSRTESNGRQHLMMFITPTILTSRDEGVTEVPKTQRPSDPQVGPAIEEFEPTIMQYAEAHRPVPTRSLRSDYPDSRPRVEPTPTVAPTPASTGAAPSINNSSEGSVTDYSNRTLVLAGPSRAEMEKLSATRQTATIATTNVAQASKPAGSKPTKSAADIAAARARLEKAAAMPAPTPAPTAIAQARAAASPTPAPAAEKVTIATTVPNPAAVEWQGNKPKGGNGAVVEAVQHLRSEMADLKTNVDLSNPSPRSQKRLAALERETKRLLDYVDTQKYNPDAIEQLDPAWWDLTRIKGQSKALRDASGMAAVQSSDIPQ